MLSNIQRPILASLSFKNEHFLRNAVCRSSPNAIRNAIKRHSSTLRLEQTTAYDPSAPEPVYHTLGATTKLNLFSAINAALRTAMTSDPTAILFGEDIAFGGVFRCSQGLREEFGEGRVFNTPLSENGIAGMAVGYASAGGTAIGEMQFADYIFPAMDQIVNEMAKFR